MIAKIQIWHVQNSESSRLNQQIWQSMRKYFEFELHTIKIADLAQIKTQKAHLIIFENVPLAKIAYPILEEIQNHNQSLHIAMIVAKYSEQTAIKIYDNHIDYIFDANYSNKYFIAKLKAILKRKSAKYQHELEISFKNIVINQLQREVLIDGQFIATTNKEYKLLKELVKNNGKFVAQQAIFEKVWGYKEDPTRLMSQYLHRLKGKIGQKVKIANLRDEGLALI